MDVAEVRFGGLRKDGGSRSSSLVFGGANAMPFHPGFASRRPVISHDVFDIPIHLPSHVAEFFGDAMQDPADWARLRVKNGAEAVTLHLISTDPKVADTSVAEAARKVEDVLQAVSVPLIVGGSGNPKKDPILLSKIAESFSGERLILSSVDPDMDFKSVAGAAKTHGHVLLSLVSMNPDEMRRFNRKLLKLGLKPEDLVMDLFTGGVGYGLEYSVSAMERARLAGLGGDPFLCMPLASATSNAWSAREAWLRNPDWGPREKRGPLWETLTAELALLSGADLFMMLHPESIIHMESLISSLFSSREKPHLYNKWVVSK